MTGKQLTTQNAMITTASVEVKTLTISGKQVTLAVFRQLKEEALVADDGTLNGEPWGTVNYHPDKCGDSAEHLHVVWQNDDELRRSLVRVPGVGVHSHPAADLYVQARIIHGTIHRPHSEPEAGDSLRLSEKIPGGWRMFLHGRFQHDGMDFRGTVPDQMRKAWNRSSRAVSEEDRQAFETALAGFGISAAEPIDQITAKLLAAIPTKQYRITAAELSALPQLFIAV